MKRLKKMPEKPMSNAKIIPMLSCLLKRIKETVSEPIKEEQLRSVKKGWRETAVTAACLLCAFCSTSASATDHDGEAESRPVTSLYAIEIGHRNVLATYLSPLHYKGGSTTLSGAWSKAMPFSPEKAIMHFDADLSFSSLLNPAQTAKMIGLYGSFNWGMSWRHRLPASIQLTAGGTVGIEGGAYYLLRNGNNPVEAIANTSLSIRASLSRPIRIGRLPVLLRDEVSLPAFSVFFSPEYGETYYEIYLGNHKGLAHAGWWGNNFRIDNLLSATLDFGRTAMTVGYRFDAYTQWACNLNTRVMTHSFVIGVVPGGIGLKKRKPRLPAETIYSIY